MIETAKRKTTKRSILSPSISLLALEKNGNVKENWENFESFLVVSGKTEDLNSWGTPNSLSVHVNFVMFWRWFLWYSLCATINIVSISWTLCGWSQYIPCTVSIKYTDLLLVGYAEKPFSSTLNVIFLKEILRNCCHQRNSSSISLNEEATVKTLRLVCARVLWFFYFSLARLRVNLGRFWILYIEQLLRYKFRFVLLMGIVYHFFV